MAGIPSQGNLTNHGDARDLAVPALALLESPGLPPGSSALSLLAALGLSGATGRLRLATAPGKTLEFGVQKGSVVQADRTGVPFEDLASAWLIERKVVDRARIAAIRAANPGRPLLQALYAAKACAASDVVDALRGVRESLLEEALRPGTVAYAWLADAPVQRPDPVGVDLVAYAASGVRAATRTSYAQDMEPLLEHHMGRYVWPTERLTPLLAGTVLSDKERKVLEVAADGTSTLHDAVAMSLLTRTQTARLFALCTFLGFVDYRVQGLPKGGVEALESELKGTLERIKGEDFFQRLGVHWTTHPKHYEAAWRKMLERWGPGAAVRRHSEFCGAKAAEILELMDEAYRTIANARTRSEYRVTRMGPDTIRFGTDFLFKQAHLAAFREDWPLAQEIIESAIDILPRPDFREFLEAVLIKASGKR